MPRLFRRYILPTSLALVSVTACSQILGLDDPSIIGNPMPDPNVDEGGSAADGPTGDGPSESASNAKDATSDARIAADAVDAVDAAHEADVDAGPAGTVSSSLALGNFHSCALVGSTVKCWGKNDQGQLGHAGAGATSATPLVVDGLTDATQISAAADSTCARRANGKTKCWGVTAHAPDPIASLVAEVRVREFHSCVRYDDGSAGCWGSDSFGQRGGTNGGPIAGLAGAVEIGTGTYTSYARIAGQVWAWGNNANGELGRGSLVPTQDAVPAAASGLTAVVQLSAGASYACALSVPVAGGPSDVFCWGNNNIGQLGTGPSSHSAPTLVTGGITSWVQVSAYHQHSCARTVAGEIYCWGDNNSGKLGTGSAAPSSSDMPIKLPAFGVAAAAGQALDVAVGFDHTCARSTLGTYCWGNGSSGQTADVALGFSSSPRVVNL